ncbi:MAG: hypothetical protein GSR85_05005 [Desulfurococcales archaeon]|nr:hypothetical protein [Desulfurococcales archaeon]
MRLIAVIYIALLALMYAPLLFSPTSGGWILYTYWSLLATISVIVAWLATRRWAPWRGS